MISIIIIANKEEIFKSFVQVLNKQKNVDYELLVIENYDNHIVSAREALKKKAQISKGDYLLFMHPDIVFLDENVLSSFCSYLYSLNNSGIIGVAGSPSYLIDNKRIIISSIVHGNNKKNAGRPLDFPKLVQTVDECMFAISKELFDSMSFADIDGFHMFGVELCLKSILKNRNNYVVPANIWHMSDGQSMDSKYMITLLELSKELGRSFPYINTTVKRWHIHGAVSFLYNYYYLFKQLLKKKILKM